MKWISGSKLILWALVLSLVFITAINLVPRVELMTVLNGIFLGIVVAVVIVYAPLTWLSIRKGMLDRVSQLALGIVLIWISIAGQRLYWIIWNAHGQPHEWTSNPFLAAMAFFSIIGGALFVTAPGYLPESSLEQNEFWGANRNLLLCLGALGGSVTFALSVFSGGF